MSDLRNVSSNPHIRAKDTTSRIMLTVVIALLLPAFFGIYNFGFRALVLILISIATCVLTEYIYEKLMKKPITIGDFSAVVTGLLLALNLPVSVPFWIPQRKIIRFSNCESSFQPRQSATPPKPPSAETLRQLWTS